ncbi:hypothetical protein [Blautia obeum]|nr:hypothetical protein [Blautia obeum]
MKKKKKISTNYVAAIIIFICAVVISLGLFCCMSNVLLIPIPRKP